MESSGFNIKCIFLSLKCMLFIFSTSLALFHMFDVQPNLFLDIILTHDDVTSLYARTSTRTARDDFDVTSSFVEEHVPETHSCE